MAECKKHPGTQRVVFQTAKGMDYVACPTCKAEKDAGKVAAPPASRPAKKATSKSLKDTGRKKAAAKSTGRKAAAKSTPAKSADKPYSPTPASKTAGRTGLFARFGLGSRG